MEALKTSRKGKLEMGRLDLFFVLKSGLYWLIRAVLVEDIKTVKTEEKWIRRWDWRKSIKETKTSFLKRNKIKVLAEKWIHFKNKESFLTMINISHLSWIPIKNTRRDDDADENDVALLVSFDAAWDGESWIFLDVCRVNWVLFQEDHHYQLNKITKTWDADSCSSSSSFLFKLYHRTQ